MHYNPIHRSIAAAIGALLLGGAWPAGADKPARPSGKDGTKAKEILETANLLEGASEIWTDCFHMKLPDGFAETRRKKLDRNRDWIGAWSYESVGGRMKVFVRCSPFRAGPFAQLVDQNMAHLRRKIKNWKRTNRQFDRDVKDREVAITVGSGRLPHMDITTGETVESDMMIARIFKRHKQRNIQVAVTVIANADRADEGAQLLEMINDSFKIMSPEEKRFMKKRVKNRPSPAARPGR
jgi:hypothetical protein